MLVGYLLTEHLEKQGGGKVVADVGFVLNLPYDVDRVRGADVAFISSDRLPEGKLPEKFFKGPPDLAVEVLSFSDKTFETEQKIRDYLEAGCRLVWLISPLSRIFR